MKNFIPFCSILVLLGCGRTELKHTPITLDQLKIDVYGESREIAYTNKQAGFLYTETNEVHRTSWQGWNVMGKEILEDYQIIVNEKPLSKSEVNMTMVSPHQFTRGYKTGVLETVTLMDSIDALVVELAQLKGERLTIKPLFTDSDQSEEYVVKPEQDVVLIAQKRHLRRTPTENYPVWTGITFAQIPNDSKPVLEPQSIGTAFSPAGIQTPLTSREAVVIFAAGDSEEQTIALAHELAANYKNRIVQRKTRMEQLLNHAYARTDNEQFDKALHWAMLSMDALIMNQTKKGIFAGLPWFNNYWGRDSFISLPGATLVTGNFSDAKEIIRSFAEWQEKNPKSPNYGRIPNLVTTSSMQYNTTDGTPRLIIALYDYVKYSGDTTFAKELYPVVKRSIEGAFLYHVDNHGFLTHGDAETWMDAVGSDGPWSPRGNRANDIQALWYKQLKAGEALARLLNDQQSKELWSKIAKAVRANFNKYFVDSTRTTVFDHLNNDGSADRQLRPNQLFSFDLLDEKAKGEAFKVVTEKLVYPHGVVSLSQDDENFHPYHHYQPYYVQDAAYHNGIVWTWLAGAWIDAAAHFGLPDLAFQVTQNMVYQILDRGAVGTMSELLDAAHRPSDHDPRLSGTFSQAWSLAEFIRVFYQDYLGVTIDATQRIVTLKPRLPSAISQTQFLIPVGKHHIEGSYYGSAKELEVTLKSNLPDTISITFHGLFDNGITQETVVKLPPKETIIFQSSATNVTQEVHGQKGEVHVHKTIIDSVFIQELKNITLATPAVSPDLKALKGPHHRLLRNDEIKIFNPQAKDMYNLVDPAKDDNGTGKYAYPLTPLLKPGSLDITRFKAATDERNAYFHLEFRNLSNPGWHPEYGFQLTYVAIAIDKDSKRGSGQTRVGMNSNYVLDPTSGYETIIYIGGGIRVADAQQKILAEYLPAEDDAKNPLGNAQHKMIEFSLPFDLIGTAEPSWRYTVLVGCQDDHGGAGVGDFRTVEAVAKEWIGGGKRKPSDPNVFDVMLPTIQK